MNSTPHKKASPITVYLLGTGGPEFTTNRYGPSTLVKVGDSHFLFDTGRGVAQRIYECGIPFTKIDKIFYTHMHSDHIEGLPNLWMAPWFLLGRTALHFYGPEGTKSMTDGVSLMFAHDYINRVNEFAKRAYLDMQVSEFAEDGVVYDDGMVKIISFTVEHSDGNPAYGFRLEHMGRSVVISGDTTYHENTVKYGKDCDVLVLNVIAISQENVNAEPWLARVIAKQTTPEQGASIFTQTKPKVAVLSHVSKIGYSGDEGDERIVERVRTAGYEDTLYLGYDRMRIEIGDDGVEVFPPNALEDVSDLQ